jgi:hypothetical protein
MTQTEFNALYREARLTLKFMASSTWTKHMGQFVTPEQRREAEARWISWQKVPRMAPAMKAVADSCHIGGTISNAALYDLRHCGGERRDWYLRMARESHTPRPPLPFP